jgi:serine phosphatase RsbU (regulator of sigma subunit)
VLPADAWGRMTLRYRGIRGTDTYSAVDLLRSGVPADAFAGKIVLVGLAAAGTSDVITTPVESQTYGVLAQAEAVNAISGAGALGRPDWTVGLEAAIALLAALGAWWLTPRLGLGGMAIGALGLGVAAVGGSYLAFLNGILIDPTPMVGPGIATSAAMVAVLFVEGRAAQSRLRAALDDERLSAAKIAGELSAASDIQSGMLLPRAALQQVSDAVEIDAVLQPAKSVGGDLYDAFMIDDRRLCVLLGDVTGKGVPASLFMALSKALSRSLLMQPHIPLDRAVGGINAELSRDNGQMMAVSLLVGVLDVQDGTLDLVSAGHENPLVIDASGAVRVLKLEGGPPLCVVETYPYPVERHRLEPGETLVCYTDGVSEAQDPEGALFGRKRTAEVVAGGQDRPLAEIVDRLVAAVRAFEAGGEPSDDLTVLAARRRVQA